MLKDISLKLRFKRILFQTGYYSPIEVELSQYEALGQELKRMSLTDLDVLGLKFDATLTPHRVVCDCKSGQGTSAPNRLFWLRGVKEYFGADVAYYLCPRIGSNARGMAPKLGVRTLDEKDIQLIEKDLNVDSFRLPLHDSDFHQQKQALWGISVPKGAKPSSDQLELKKVYSFLSYNYWYMPQYRNLFLLVAQFQKIAHLLNPLDPRDILLAHVGLERFAHCLLEMGSNIRARGLTNIQQSVRLYLYGGSLALREREQYFKLLNKLTGSNEPLDPPFINDIIELANRMIHNPYATTEVLRYLEAIYDWCVQLGNKNLDSLFLGNLITGAIVLGRDNAITFAKATGVREQLFSVILGL